VRFSEVGTRRVSWESREDHCTPGAIVKEIRRKRCLPRLGWHLDYAPGATAGRVVIDANITEHDRHITVGTFAVEFLT